MQSGLFDAVEAGHTVLVPNTELAAALNDSVERRYLGSGAALWATPQIRDFGSWLREQYVQRQFREPGLPRCLSDIEERELWRLVILEGAAGREFLEPAGAARAARRARRAIVEYGIPLEAVAAVASEEAVALLHWNRVFDERCRALHCIAADRLPEFLQPASRSLAWIESPIWRPVARGWLQRHAALLLLPTTGTADIHTHRAASSAEELSAMADWALGRLNAVPQSRTWICLPELGLRRGEVVDTFDAVLSPQRFSLLPQRSSAPYAVAGGTPLSDYPPVRAALAVLAAATGTVSFEEFSALVLLPDLHASAADSSAAARLDVELRSRGPNAAPFEVWLTLAEQVARERLTADVAVLARLRAVWRVLSVAPRSQRLSAWAPCWIGAFDAGPWQQRARWSSTEYQSAERCRELLATLATADDIFGAQSAASAVRTLSRAARDTAFQPQTGIPQVWISGQLMDPWLRYDALWIAGCSAERWPPPPDPLPLLPVRLQRDYGVVAAGAESQLRLAEDLQRRWAGRADVGVFSCADPGDGRTSRLSPLLPASAHVVTAGTTQPHWRALAARAPQLDSLADAAAPRFREPERTRGVATLRAQSLCAFRGFALTRLQADALDHPVPGFNPRERGELLHHALESIWRVLQTSAALEAIDPDALRALIAAGASGAIARQITRRDPGLRWRAREHERLVGLLGKWLDAERERAPFAVERLEEAAQTARHGGLAYRIRIDRIDRLAAGGRVLIDYKSGITAADWRGERPDNPQLPVYALLQPEDLVAVAYGRVNASECGFVHESERDGIFKPRGRKTALEGRADFAELIAEWARRIERIATAFADGDAAVVPTAHACASCDLHALCRIHE